MSQQELALRLHVSRFTLISIEKGSPKVAIGTVFEATNCVGIALLGEDIHELHKRTTIVSNLISILPKRSRRKKEDLDDNF